MHIFKKEKVVSNTGAQDLGKLRAVDSHELLKKENSSDQITSFDEVRTLGRWFLNQNFNSVLLSSKELPQDLLATHRVNGNKAFLAKLALGTDPESHFPVTAEVIETQLGVDLRLHIVPIHFAALQVARFEQPTDSLLALAAAAAVAPQFILALEGGIETNICTSKKENVTSISPDHGTPLAVTFDAFSYDSTTLNEVEAVTGNQAVTIKQAAHLHGKSKSDTQQISRAAANSRIAAGVTVHTLLRSQLPKHALFIPTEVDPISGKNRIVGMNESLLRAGVANVDLSFLAAALGFTAQVVGNSSREQIVEKIISPSFSETPLREVVTA